MAEQTLAARWDCLRTGVQTPPRGMVLVGEVVPLVSPAPLQRL
jgi:hypothetical protein